MASKILLIPISSKDEAEFLAAVARSRALHRPWAYPAGTPKQFRALLKRMHDPANRCYLVRRRDTKALAGFIGISNIVRGLFKSGYLGYHAFAGHERQGLMREAVQLAIRKAFKDLRLHRLEANIQPGNRASIALARCCGFKKEGYSPRYLKLGGRWRDHERWAIMAR
jgi:ribosomal-protein-alanine N-acetyltransferase